MEAEGQSAESIAAFIGGKSPLDGTLQRRIRGEVGGDLETGEVHAGQISGLVHQVLPASVVIQRMVDQAEAIIAALRAGG